MIILFLILALIILFCLFGYLYLRLNPQFGGNLTERERSKYACSPYWKDGKFVNLEETNMDISAGDIPGLLLKQLTDRKSFYPDSPLPVLPFIQEVFLHDDTIPKFVWYGHSVILLRINGVTLLIDPMFGSDASPIAPFKSRRFSRDTLDLIDTLPPIDAVLLSHDHYDHLDYKSINRLKDRTDTFLVALGVARHLESWGIAPEKVIEMDWYDQLNFKGVRITFTPSRHFSGRGITDRFKSLWGGFVFDSGEHCLYLSGDGGYGKHFAEINERFGPFDWIFVECGQYNEHWHQIHMYPEESIQAAKETHSAIAMPIHWGAFALALHPWTDPVNRFVHQAIETGQAWAVPRLGEVVEISNPPDHRRWWEKDQ